MGFQTIFQRYEMKYLLTERQRDLLLREMEPHMEPDAYGRTTIRNIYFDTDTYRLIRRSIERPAYKEKLRLRSYRQASSDAPVFVELKKKYRSVVYKRRLALPERQAVDWLSGRTGAPLHTQIAEEIEYFRNYYQPLGPSAFLSYEREAFYSRTERGFRVTFDTNILCRQEALSLEDGVWGAPLLPPGRVLLEIKTGGGIPLWMTGFLTRQRIYKTSFSKYGTAYRNLIFPIEEGGTFYA